MPPRPTRPGRYSARSPWRARSADAGRLTSQHRVAHEFEAVVAEVHVVAADEQRRRAEAAARDHFVGIGLELRLDLGPRDALEEPLRLEADARAEIREHLVLRDVPAVRPVRCEHFG